MGRRKPKRPRAVLWLLAGFILGVLGRRSAPRAETLNMAAGAPSDRQQEN